MENEQETNVEVEEQEQEADFPEQENEALVREIESGKAAITEMKQALAAKDTEIAALNQSLEGAKKRLEETAKSLEMTVGTYRELVVQTNPGVLKEMIAGDSIEKINESLQSARAIMERAKREVEAEAARVRVQAGAPQRAAQDLSALSPREKIQYGLETK